MYVLLDIEWVTNTENHICPTQVAAFRVTEQWAGRELFFRRIRPRDNSFHVWSHVGYTGGTKQAFLHAQPLTQVMQELLDWLRADDVICVWHAESEKVLRAALGLGLKRSLPHKVIVLRDYLINFHTELTISSWKPHKIAPKCGWQVVKPAHKADNDVMNMRQALLGLAFPAKRLLLSPEEIEEENQLAAQAAPVYYQDDWTDVIHKEDCALLSNLSRQLKNVGNQFLLRQDLQFCDCMREARYRARRERNRDTIARMGCNYVYAESSQVFHRRECGLILQTVSQIKGTVYYKTCADTGRRPCACCRPDANAKDNCRLKKPSLTRLNPPDRRLTTEEKRGLARYHQARQERIAGAQKSFATAAQREDFYTLTQPGCGFFAATGYATFHLRKCRKLEGLSGLKGFATYQEALNAGHTPCKCCKPTAKDDITCSVPMGSIPRKGERVQELAALCEQCGYPYVVQDTKFKFTTAVGRWIIETAARPYIVKHINLVMTPQNETTYHRQPRIFLSMVDAFLYIKRHDEALQNKQRDVVLVDIGE